MYKSCLPNGTQISAFLWRQSREQPVGFTRKAEHLQWLLLYYPPLFQDERNISCWWICSLSNINSPLILSFSVICIKANIGSVKYIWSHWGCFVATWALEASKNLLYPLHLHCLTSKVGGSRKTTWASPGQQDNTGNLPCQVLEKKLWNILENKPWKLSSPPPHLTLEASENVL